jgi:hypothetical protein
MSDILGDLPYVRVYIDDFIVFSNSSAEHTMHLTEVLQRLNLFFAPRDTAEVPLV